jgi:hypothetical protein
MLKWRLAQIVVESFCSGKPHFCRGKKATNGSCFWNVQKGFETKNLQRIAGVATNKKRQNLPTLTLKYTTFLITPHRTSL